MWTGTSLRGFENATRKGTEQGKDGVKGGVNTFSILKPRNIGQTKIQARQSVYLKKLCSNWGRHFVGHFEFESNGRDIGKEYE